MTAKGRRALLSVDAAVSIGNHCRTSGAVVSQS